MAAIAVRERGKLSRYRFKERSNAAGPYHKLRRWQAGKNHTRHVSAEELPAVQTALAGYAQFQQLSERYAELVIAETRQHIAGSKKKPFRPKSSWPRKPKSSN